MSEKFNYKKLSLNDRRILFNCILNKKFNFYSSQYNIKHKKNNLELKKELNFTLRLSSLLRTTNIQQYNNAFKLYFALSNIGLSPDGVGYTLSILFKSNIAQTNSVFVPFIVKNIKSIDSNNSHNVKILNNKNINYNLINDSIFTFLTSNFSNDVPSVNKIANNLNSIKVNSQLNFSNSETFFRCDTKKNKFFYKKFYKPFKCVKNTTSLKNFFMAEVGLIDIKMNLNVSYSFKKILKNIYFNSNISKNNFSYKVFGVFFNKFCYRERRVSVLKFYDSLFNKYQTFFNNSYKKWFLYEPKDFSFLKLNKINCQSNILNNNCNPLINIFKNSFNTLTPRIKTHFLDFTLNNKINLKYRDFLNNIYLCEKENNIIYKSSYSCITKSFKNIISLTLKDNIKGICNSEILKSFHKNNINRLFFKRNILINYKNPTFIKSNILSRSYLNKFYLKKNYINSEVSKSKVSYSQYFNILNFLNILKKESGLHNYFDSIKKPDTLQTFIMENSDSQFKTNSSVFNDDSEFAYTKESFDESDGRFRDGYNYSDSDNFQNKVFNSDTAGFHYSDYHYNRLLLKKNNVFSKNSEFEIDNLFLDQNFFQIKDSLLTLFKIQDQDFTNASHFSNSRQSDSGFLHLKNLNIKNIEMFSKYLFKFNSKIWNNFFYGDSVKKNSISKKIKNKLKLIEETFKYREGFNQSLKIHEKETFLISKYYKNKIKTFEYRQFNANLVNFNFFKGNPLMYENYNYRSESKERIKNSIDIFFKNHNGIVMDLQNSLNKLIDSY